MICPDGNFPDFACRQCQRLIPGCNGFVGNPDDPGLKARHRPAHADTGPRICLVPGVPKYFRAADGGHREAFGCAVRREDLGARRHHGDKSIQNFGRHRCARRNGASQCRQFQPVFFPVATNPVDQCRGSKHVGDVESFNGAENIFRVHRGRSRGIHLWNHRGHAQCRTEQCKQGEGGQIGFTGFDAVEIPDVRDLGPEHCVRINDAFGRAGAAAGEENGGSLLKLGLNRFTGAGRRCHGVQFLKAVSTPEPTGANSHAGADSSPGPSKNDPRRMGL